MSYEKVCKHTFILADIKLVVLPLAGETCEINFEQQTKIPIFYFQELRQYVVLFLWGGEHILWVGVTWNKTDSG